MTKDLIFNSERLRTARLMNGYSLQELSDKIENMVSKQSLNKYEKSEVVPDTEKVEKLAAALNVKPSFFYRAPKVTLGELSFRKLQDFSVKESNIITEKIRDFLERYIELEESMGITEHFTNPVQDFIIKDSSDVEEATEIIREKWNMGFDAISNVIDLFEDHNIKVIEVEADDKLDGCQTIVNGIIPVIVMNKNVIKPCDRKRFTALHELGHLLLNFEKSIDEKQQEKLCHRFAGAMLMHKSAVIKAFGEKRISTSIPELGAIKLKYGISIAALLYRLKDLNIISANFYKHFMFMLSITDQRKVEPYPYTGKESGHRFKQLLYRALAEKKLDYEKAAEISGQTEQEIKDCVFSTNGNYSILSPLSCG